MQQKHRLQNPTTAIKSILSLLRVLVAIIIFGLGSDFSPVKILVYFYHFNKTEFLTDYKNIKIGDFSYHLPEERIARYPLAERDSSALLVWQNGRINKDKFKNITDYLPTDSMLVFNNTRVIHARLFFKKDRRKN